MKLNFRLGSGLLRAITIGLMLGAVLPAIQAATISITTSAGSGTLGDASNSFSFTGANIGSFSTVPVAFSGATLSTSFGYFSDYTPGSASNSNIVDIFVKPNVNGSLGNLDFKGTMSKVGSIYSLNFSATPGAVSFNVAGVDYTGLVFNGYEFAFATVQQLNTGGGGKQTWLKGYVTTAATPEPASIAMAGLGFLVCGLFMRRRLASVNVR